MERGVTDVFQEDLNMMVGGGLDHPDYERNSSIDEDFDPQCDVEEEEDRNAQFCPTEFDETD